MPFWLLPLLVVAAALLGLGLHRGWLARDLPRPPRVDLDGVDRMVAQRITSTRNRVLWRPRSADAWGMLGKVLQAHGFAAGAELCYDRAAELDPRDPRWPYLVALGRRGTDPDAALPYLERAAALERDVASPRVALGELLLAKDCEEEAEALLLDVLGEHPEDAHALFGRARIALARGNLDQAIDSLLRSTANAPAVKASHALLAAAHDRSGNREAAEAEQEAMAGLSDDWVWPDRYLEEMMSTATGLNARLAWVRALHRSGRDAEALAHLRALERDYPDDNRPFRIHGEVLGMLGRTEEAEQVLRTAVRLSPEDASIHFDLGIALQFQKKDEAAAGSYREAIRLQPSLAMAHFNLGLILRSQGDLDAALQELRESVRYQPDFAPAHKHLGNLLAQRGQYELALPELERARRLAPEDASIAESIRKVRARLARPGAPMR